MTDVEAVVERWFVTLNELDPAIRGVLVEETWTPDGRWVDPPFEGEGHEAISGMIGSIYESYPNHRFRQASAIDAHHDSLRIGWELVSPDGDIVLAGTDVGTLDGDGRLARVTGFFDTNPHKRV